MNRKQTMLAEFEALGYRRGPAARLSAKGSFWYERESASPGIRQFALVAPKKTLGGFGVYVGVEHRPSRFRAEASQSLIAKYLHPLELESSVRVFDNPSWVVFNLGRALDWPLFAIADPLDPAGYQSRFASLVALLESRVWSIHGPPELYRALVQEESPFDWVGTRPVLRAAQIVAIGKFLGMPAESIRVDLLRNRFEIGTQIHGGAPVEQLVDDFIAGI